MRGDPFVVLARAAIRYRRTVILAWLVIVVAAGVLGTRLQPRLQPGGFEIPGSQSLAVQQSLERSFPGWSAAPALVVVRHPRLRAADPRFAAVVERLRRRLVAVDGVVAVTGGGASADGHTLLLVASLGGDESAQMRAAARVAAAAGRELPGGFEVATGGRPALYDQVNRISKADLEKSELVSIVPTALVLVFAFGSIVAAGLPLLLGVASLGVTLGALFLLSHATALSIYVTNTASIIGIGVGIDYSLFVLARYREERRRGHPVETAIERTLATSGRSVVVSGLTVMVGIAGLFVVDIQSFRSMAIGCVTVVGIAVAASLTLLPSVLAAAGPRIDRLAVHRNPGDRSRGWHAWAMLVMRHPVAFLGAALVLLGVVTVPLLSLHLGQPSARTLPPGTGPRVALERIAAAFAPGATGPVEIVVETPRGASGREGLARLTRLERLLGADPGVVAVTSIADVPPPLRRSEGMMRGLVSRDGRLARVTVVGRAIPQSDAGQELVRRIRERIVPLAGLRHAAAVGGTGASDLDVTTTISHSVPRVIATVLGLSLLLLILTLRSVVLPLKALAMNLLSVGAAYGAVVAVFQWGWGSGLLGFTPEGQIQAFVPLFLFCVLFGLSMDYEIFLLSRIREEYLRTGDNRSAVAIGLERTGRTVTSASLIMVTIFLAFAGSRLLAFKAIGLGLAFAILVDAAVIRVIAVPAAMRLLGRWNWWLPALLARRVPVLKPAQPADAAIDRRDRSPAPAPSSTTSWHGL